MSKLKISAKGGRKEATRKAGITAVRHNARREAAQWVVQLAESVTPGKARRFKAWINAADLNAKEYALAQRVWEAGNLAVESDSAYIALTVIECWECHKEIPVIHLCAKEASADGEVYKQKDTILRMCDITAMDQRTTALLREAFPDYRPRVTEEGKVAEYANHCPHCGLIYEDMVLHDESVFLMLAAAPAGAIRYLKIPHRIRLNADVGTEMGEEAEDLHALLDHE